MKSSFTTLLLLISTLAFAQGNEVEMADQFRADGKIYVVVAIVLVILAGLFTYLIFVDRKVSRIEKQLNKKL
jgi:hypothetical protein